MQKFTADFETATWLENETYVWAWAICEIGNPDNFIYGKNPRFNIENNIRIEGVGDFKALIEVDKSIIKNINIMGDYFLNEEIDVSLLERLKGVAYNVESIRKVVDEVNICDIILNMDNEHCVAREKYAVIVSNPPYVRECEKAEMEENVLEYDPHTALFVSNEDPLIFYRSIGEFGLSHLEKDGALYFEINQYLGQETCDLLIAMGYKNVELRADINGNARMVKATL